MKDLREQLASRIQKISLGSTFGLSMLMIFIIFFINFEGCGIKKIDKEEIKAEEIIDLEALRKKFRFPIDIDTARAQKLFFEPTDTTDINTEIVFNPEVEEEVIDTLSIDSLIKYQVAKTTHTKSTARSAGTRLALDSAGLPVDFSDSIPFVANFKTKMALDVWSPRKKIPVTLRLESSTNDTAFVEVTVRTGKANEWDSLTFDFSNPDSGIFNPDSIDYDRIYVYFDKGEKKRNESFYWDNLELVETAKEISFEASSSQSSAAKEVTPEPPKPVANKEVKPKPDRNKADNESNEESAEEDNNDTNNEPEGLTFERSNDEDLTGKEDNNGKIGERSKGDGKKGKKYGFGTGGDGGTLLKKGTCPLGFTYTGPQTIKVVVCVDYNGNVTSVKFADPKTNKGSTTTEQKYLEAAKCAVNDSEFKTKGMVEGDSACGTFTFVFSPGGISF